MRQYLADLPIYFHEENNQPFENDKFYFLKSQNIELVEILNSLKNVPKGISSLAKHLGISKNGELDFTVIKLDEIGVASGVYTQSLCPSEAVKFDRANTDRGNIQLLCVISKNANVFTPTSKEDIRKICRELSKEFQVPEESILISCTGVIGVPLPMKQILGGIKNISKELDIGCLHESAQAIMTTDKKEKMVSVQFDDIIICGFAKGAGMIEPNMATMLSFFFTNANIEKPLLDIYLKNAVDKSFNSISIDTDTSTSDTVILISTNEIKINEAQKTNFERALNAMCMKLARDIVGLGEGVTKIIEARVGVETSYHDAKIFAKKIINSPLVKTAIYGADPNWGRIVMAIGKPTEMINYPEIIQENVKIKLMGEIVFNKGETIDLNLEEISNKIKAAKAIAIDIEIGNPLFFSTVWGCDLTEEYVKINSSYTS